MKLKPLFVGIILSEVIALSACSEQDPESTAKDAELQQKLIGVWCYTDSVVYDDDGEIASFSAFEFTDDDAKCHDVSAAKVLSYVIDKYTIKDGYYTVDVDGKEEYAVIDIREVDGKDHLYWSIDTGTQEFIRMTDEEIDEYGIPAGQLLPGEAELLGIETDALDLETTDVSELQQ
ncbi:MAG: hypothetical protein ACI4I1_10540 [Oscillospiraceae bacterium]